MSDRVKHFFKYQFPAIGWAIIIFLGSSIPAKYIPQHTIFTYDKLIHIALFLVFGVLVYRALEPLKVRDSLSLGRIVFSISIVILYGILDELHQGSVPGRTLDIWDAVADAIGGIIASFLVYFNYLRRRIINRIN